MWIDAPPIPGIFLCNIGDMLDRMTGGYYKSTPHRVLNSSVRSRLSFPLFFDPNFESEISPIIELGEQEKQVKENQRWGRSKIHSFNGTYGQYLLEKIGKVFPDLSGEVL